MMSYSNARLRTRLLTLVAALALAVGAVACGDGSDDGDDGGGHASAQQVAAASSGANEATAADREEIGDTMRFLRARFNAMDGDGFCTKISQVGKEEIVRIVGNSEYGRYIKSRDCAGIVDEYTKEVIGRIGKRHWPVEMREVDVAGDEADIVMKGGLAGHRSVVPFRLVREGGEWKVVDPISARERLIRIERN